MLNILFIGDMVGKPGRNALTRGLESLLREHSVDLCIGNGENPGGGFGLTPETANDLFRLGIDVLTSGNHIFDKRKIIEHLSHDARIIRPANYPSGTPGRGTFLAKTKNRTLVGVLNLMGRVFMDTVDCPFYKANQEVEKLRKKTKIILSSAGS